MERGEVRLLTVSEISALSDACVQSEADSLSHCVFALSRGAAEDDAALRETYRFLSGVLSPPVRSILKIEELGNPFWVAPSSLRPEEVALLRQVVDAATDPDLRARCADVVWLATRDWRMGEIAADAYLDASRRVSDRIESTGAAERYERAASLAASLGRKKARYAAVIAEIEGLLASLDGADPLFLSVRLMAILLAQKQGDRAKYAALAEKAAHAAEERGNFEVARRHWDLAGSWHAAGEDAAGVRAARVGAAESQVREAASRATDRNPSYLAAASILQGAIALLQKAGGAKDRVEELFRLLKGYEAQAIGELQPISGSFDVSDLAASARDEVAGKSLPAAIGALSSLVYLPDRHGVRAAVLKAAKDFPLQHLFGGALLDRHGALIAGRGAVDADEEDHEDLAVLASMYEDVGRTFTITALGEIDPARRQIADEHDVREVDLSVIAHRSWFVPPEREALFARGLLAGFHGDFLLALHLLVPQVEAALRWSLRQRGYVTSRLNRDGFQEEMDLNQLLARDAAREVLGENLCFALRALLTSRFGSNLRNRLAHGLIEMDEMYSAASVYCWALILKVCVRTAIEIAPQQGDSSGG